MRIILSFLLFCSFLFANDVFGHNQEQPQDSTAQKILYLSYDSIPSKVIVGEVFPVTIKSLSTQADYQDISYSFEKASGINLIDDSPNHTVKGSYFYDTFYFQATKIGATLPDVVATVANSNGNKYPTSTTLQGEPLNVAGLNPRNDFSNILAETFNIVSYKVTSYDTEHNIILFTATATRSDLGTIHIKNVAKQGIETLDNSYANSKVTYYAVIKKGLENFAFSYYNLTTQKFEKVSLTIIVDDDRVTTQSDLRPKDQQFSELKVIIASGVAFFFVLMIFWKRKFSYFLLLLLPVAYIIYIVKPAERICVKKGANIYLLPLSNGTIFETTDAQGNLEVEGNTRGYVKVKLSNKTIGWVKESDACSN